MRKKYPALNFAFGLGAMSLIALMTFSPPLKPLMAQEASAQVAASSSAYDTPIGFWLSEATKSQFGGVFQIYQEGSEFKGKIVRLLPRIGHPDDDLNTKCGGCEGALKDHPTVGLPFIYGFKKEADRARWSGGKVIDSRSGNAYSARMEVVENGKKLKVRGYLGTPMLGATVYWTRVTSKEDLRSPL